MMTNDELPLMLTLTRTLSSLELSQVSMSAADPGMPADTEPAVICRHKDRLQTEATKIAKDSKAKCGEEPQESKRPCRRLASL